MRYIRRNSPSVIRDLQSNEVFVFNSYSNGINKYGTAKAALEYHGAKLGVGEGPTGQSYAIPSEIPLEQMRAAVERFIQYAKDHPKLVFLVTPIGTGEVFKRNPNDMANLFIDAIPVENILLPELFVDILNSIIRPQENDFIHIGDNLSTINYKLIEHDDCEFNDSAVMKQNNGKYTLLQRDHMSMGGGWKGFKYLKTRQDYDSILFAVVPQHKSIYSRESEFIQSCVIVKRNGLWGSISTRFEDYFAEVVPIKYVSADEVKVELKKVANHDLDYIWKTYEEYSGADEYLRLEYMKEFRRAKVIVGDITTLKVDAIVNAANSSLLGGGGIDGAIHRAAGLQLLEECKKLGGCNVGESKMTDAYNLPCKKIIHTVGPNMNVITDWMQACELLANCYKSVLDIAQKNGLKSVAFCCISTGIYGFPKKEAAEIATRVIYEHPYDGEIIICCYTQEDKKYYDDIYGLSE